MRRARAILRAKISSGHEETLPAISSGPSADSPETDPGGSIDRYRLGAELGRGGMGRVVEAFDTRLGRTVALKEVLPNRGTGVERRFRREVLITARLEHASILTNPRDEAPWIFDWTHDARRDLALPHLRLTQASARGRHRRVRR